MLYRYGCKLSTIQVFNHAAIALESSSVESFKGKVAFLHQRKLLFITFAITRSRTKARVRSFYEINEHFL